MILFFGIVLENLVNQNDRLSRPTIEACRIPANCLQLQRLSTNTAINSLYIEAAFEQTHVWRALQEPTRRGDGLAGSPGESQEDKEVKGTRNPCKVF